MGTSSALALKARNARIKTRACGSQSHRVVESAKRVSAGLNVPFDSSLAGTHSNRDYAVVAVS